MVVILAGYAGQMSELLDKVNPGLKSRVSDVIDFPDFDAAAAAELAALQLSEKRLRLAGGADAASLAPWAERLVAAPRWANGRDVETFVRRVTIECATRKTTEVTRGALDAALASVLAMKGLSTPPPAAAAARPAPSPFMAADPVAQAPPAFDIKKAIQTAFDAADDGDDDGDDAADEVDFADALEEAIVALGFDADNAARRKLASLLTAAVDGLAPFPDVLRSRVLSESGASPELVDAALARRAKPALLAVQASIQYHEERDARIADLPEEERDEALRDEARIMERLRTMGPCPQGFAWFRSGNGWRCGGGSHFVYDDDPILNMD